MQRRRDKQRESFKNRLASFAQDAREEAAQLPPGAERDDKLKKASRADTAAHIDEWANSPELQPPKK